jgi:hypothetical protein
MIKRFAIAEPFPDISRSGFGAWLHMPGAATIFILYQFYRPKGAAE